MSDNPKPDDKGIAAAALGVISKKTTASRAAAALNRKYPKAKKKVTAADVRRWVARVRKALKNV